MGKIDKRRVFPIINFIADIHTLTYVTVIHVLQSFFLKHNICIMHLNIKQEYICNDICENLPSGGTNIVGSDQTPRDMVLRYLSLMSIFNG